MCAMLRKIGYKVTHYYIKKRKNKHIIIVFYEIKKSFFPFSWIIHSISLYLQQEKILVL